MEAPDKIYVNFPFGETHPYCGPMVTKQGLNHHDTIYIRKDALLEWAKEKNQRIDTNEGDYSLGYVSAMIDLIDKLNSM